jgi:hypothetical protein
VQFNCVWGPLLRDEEQGRAHSGNFADCNVHGYSRRAPLNVLNVSARLSPLSLVSLCHNVIYYVMWSAWGILIPSSRCSELKVGPVHAMK